MSQKMTELVWTRSQSKRGERLVMLALARGADDNGRIAISFAEIRELVQLSNRSISAILDSLEKLGEISRTRGGGQSNPSAYTILLDEEKS